MSSINDSSKKNKDKSINKKLSISEQKIYFNIEIKEGLKKQIEIDSNSNCGDIAFEFCKKNNLDYKSLIYLKKQLENTIKNPSNGNNVFDISLEKDFPKNNSHIINDKNINLNNKEEKSVISSKNNNYAININQKLFPYEFTIESNFKKKKSKDNKSNNKTKPKKNKSENLNKLNKISNRINTSSNINISSIEKDSTFNILNKSGNTIKPMNTISNFSKINSNNIFERLFNDAEIKRITYRRPCHFSSNLRNKTMGNENNNNSRISNNYNSVNLTIFSNYSNDKDRNYNNSYMYKIFKNLHNECVFQPNFTLKRSKSSHKKNNKKNVINNKNKNNGYKPVIIKEEENISSSNNDTIKNEKGEKKKNKKDNNGKVKFNTINVLNKNSENKEEKKNNTQVCHPLKDKMIWGSQDGDILLEGIRTEAFGNLFNELNGHNKNEELNENNINIEKIPTMVLYDIEPITLEIYKHKKSYSLNDFIKEMKEIFNELSMEDKRNIINLYKKSNYPIAINNTYFITSPNSSKRKNNSNLFNSRQLTHLNSSRGMHITNKSVQSTNIKNNNNNNNKSNCHYFNSAKKNARNSISHEKLLYGNEKKRNFFYVN